MSEADHPVEVSVEYAPEIGTTNLRKRWIH